MVPLSPPRAQAGLGTLAVLGALGSQYVGAALAKHLFPVVGPAGMAALRIGLALALLCLLRPPTWRLPAPAHRADLLGYGLSLGAMNLLIYQAFARVPLGVAVAIEVLGPLAVVLASTRRALDLVWLGAAAVGLGLLAPRDALGASLDPIGLGCAAGAATAFGLYIVFGRRVARGEAADAVHWGLLVAAALALPLGALDGGATLLAPRVLGLGLGVAALSSVLPYTLEMFALRRLSARAFGVLVSASPAAAALAGALLLDEALSAAQWASVALIGGAVAGSTAVAAREGR